MICGALKVEERMDGPELAKRCESIASGCDDITLPAVVLHICTTIADNAHDTDALQCSVLRLKRSLSIGQRAPPAVVDGSRPTSSWKFPLREGTFIGHGTHLVLIGERD